MISLVGGGRGDRSGPGVVGALTAVAGTDTGASRGHDGQGLTGDGVDGENELVATDVGLEPGVDRVEHGVLEALARLVGAVEPLAVDLPGLGDRDPVGLADLRRHREQLLAVVIVAVDELADQLGIAQQPSEPPVDGVDVDATAGFD